MSAAAEMIAMDFEASARFDHRMQIALRIGLILSLPLCLFQFVIAPEFSLLVHTACMLLATAMVVLHKDGWRAFFYSSPYWTFSFMLFVNASARGVSIDYNILDPDRAASIVLVSQFGIAVVGLIDALVPDRPRQASFAAVERSNSLMFAFLASSMCVLALRFTGGISPIVAKSFFYLLPILIATNFLRRGARAMDPYFLGLFGGYSALAVIDNSRTDLLSFVLMGLVLLMIFGKRFVTWQRVVLAYFLTRFLTVFSAVSIAVRPLRDTPDLMVREALSRLFSFETLYALFNPLHTHSASYIYAQRQTGYSLFRSYFYGGGDTSIFDRLTLLPQMDIVTGRLLLTTHIDFAKLWQTTIPSALPNFGQQKITMLGDELVWELALRSRDTVGRPMITSQAEAWALGGYWGVLVISIFVFACWALNYRLMLRYFGLRTVVQAFNALLIVYGILTTTILGQTLAMLRSPLQVLLLCVLISLVLQVLKTRHSMNMPKPVARHLE
ncbi:hypothetical protein [Ruegeria atlantica]|uniref:hypothetical protein n=1 Tax=Ruegeria atlantica TaxID=81569 RepID=UPI00147E7833|nr:hypothetical protein [Ruegeria atlantica]